MTFRDRVTTIVRAVPRGRVVTYGQVAALAGRPRAAREVGWIASAGESGVPWQRVVNRFGGLATGYTGGRAGHRRALRREGIRVSKAFTVDLRRYRWWPEHPEELHPFVLSPSKHERSRSRPSTGSGRTGKH